MKKGVDHIGITVVFYCHDGKGNLLLHKRSKKCRDEQGRWDVGGGAMRMGETFTSAVRREVREEYGTTVKKLNFVTAVNALRKNGAEKTHWIALLFVVQVDPKNVKIGEPKKMDEIGWFPLDKLPSPLHSMIREDLKMVKNAL